MQVEVAQVAAVEQDAPGAGVVKARNEAGDGALAHTRRAHQRQSLPGFDGERDVLENGNAVRVRKAHAVKLNAPFRPTDLHGVRFFDDVGLHIEHFRHPVGSGQRSLHLFVHTGEERHGLVEHAQVLQECDQSSTGILPAAPSCRRRGARLPFPADAQNSTEGW